MRLILEAHVTSHACFPQNFNEGIVNLQSKDDSLEFYMNNLNVEMGTEDPTMRAMLVFEAKDFESGLEEGREMLLSILRSLSFVTSFTFKYKKMIKLVDWAEGEENRDYVVAQPFPGHRLPQYILHPGHVESAFGLWRTTQDHPLGLAIHWFSSGVGSTALEDQFQFFWYALELVAKHAKSPEKVHDLCVKCRSPLYCETCGTHPQHRPFNKQAIEVLIRSHTDAKDADDILARSFKTRNMLMHGATRDQIEVDLGVGIQICVNDVALVARKAILASLHPQIEEKRFVASLHTIEVNNYAHAFITSFTNMRSGSLKDEIPSLEKIAVPEMSMIYSEGPVEAADAQDTVNDQNV